MTPRRSPLSAAGAVKRAVEPVIEVALLWSALGAAVPLTRDGVATVSGWGRELAGAGVAGAVYLVARRMFSLGRRSWLHAGVRDLASLGFCVSGAVAGLAGAEGVARLAGSDWAPFPAATLAVGWALGYLLLTHTKLLSRARHSLRGSTRCRAMLIVGAGNAGVLLSRQIRSQRGPLDVVGFVDDDPAKHGLMLAGLPVLGDRADLAALIARYKVRTVAIAMPSALGETLDGILDEIRRADEPVQVLTVPNLHELVAGGSGLPLSEVTIADLLGRGEVTADFEAIIPTFAGKRVLVTGAAGSIGSELCRQVSRLGVDELMLLDIDETGLADVRNELRGRVRTTLLLSSVLDPGLEALMARAARDVVLHAAAYKHVDILEEAPARAAETNVLGTWRVLRAAERARAGHVVVISSDKAVDPEGVLGASKRIGERMVGAFQDSPAVVSAVRFGNVLSSRGSVVPLFEKQIAMGGPLTVTHPDVRRFFMSIPEAVHLVLQAVCIAERGGLYVLDMGDDIPIVDIARRLARLRGKRVPEDIDIVFTGLRPGERMREQLIGAAERAEATIHPRVERIVSASPDSADFWDREAEMLGQTGRMPSADLRRHLLALAMNAAGREVKACPIRA